MVWVKELAARQPDRTSLIKGPPADRAFDSAGQPTKAVEGFARSRGISVTELQIREMDGRRYASAVVSRSGRPAPQVHSIALSSWVGGLHFDKSMRWNNSGVAFLRPIRWLLALYSEWPLPFSDAGCSSGVTTRGLRFEKAAAIAITRPQEYFAAMAAQSQGVATFHCMRDFKNWS